MDVPAVGGGTFLVGRVGGFPGVFGSWFEVEELNWVGLGTIGLVCFAFGGGIWWWVSSWWWVLGRWVFAG